MTSFQPLNPLTIPIAHTNLIEASAGTGKTWNIAALFTRLIVLEHYQVDSILVVTFTKAATAELKNRLRARLDEALSVLINTPNALNQLDLLKQNCVINEEFDDFLFQLLQQALQRDSQIRLQLRLKAAISEFDHAAIYTIHGFCQRVLQDFAFLCQVPFDIQLDEEWVQHQLLISAQDFWRQTVANHSLLAQLAHQHRLTPQKQLEALQSFISRPYLPFRQPEIQAHNYEKLCADFWAIWQQVCLQLAQLEETFWALRDSKLNKNSFREPTFRQKFAQLHDWKNLPQNELSAQQICQIMQQVDSKTKQVYNPFTHDNFVNKKVSKATVLPEDTQAFVILCDLFQAACDVLNAQEAVLHQLNQDFLRHLQNQRSQWKKQYPQRIFDDLLLDLHTALLDNPEHAHTLARTLAQHWKVALIDEFQDTDPLQYAIFRTTFAHTQTPLFLVGDPKQAIYGFRGADILAYLQAAQDSQHHYTLNTNHRSHHSLIQSIGALFQRKQPFVLPNIVYNNVVASRAEPCLSPAGHAVQIRWLPNESGANTDTLTQESAHICASQIADLLAQSLSGSLKIKQQPLHAGQIAVLVRTKKEGDIMQRALKKIQIQSVLLSRNNVFSEAEALAMVALLSFIIQPQKTGLLRFVLTSVLFEYDAQQINELNTNENNLLKWIDSANQAYQHWTQYGIYAALCQFIQQHGIETRLLSQKNERSLTNLHQIMELLAQEDEASHTPTSLLQWLKQQIQAASQQHNATEHHILRLESDDNLVKIVTMHAAKGLQYPIVFCPFVWKARDNHAPEWSVSHHYGSAEIVHKNQLKQNDEEKSALAQAHLSEELRLLYVAMTRAEERLYLYVSHFQAAKSDKTDKSDKDKNDDGDKQYRNPLAYLLNTDNELTKQASAYEQHWQNFLAQQSPDTDFEWVRHDEQSFSGSLKVKPNPHSPHYTAQIYPARHFQFVQHSSFTSLLRQNQRATQSDIQQPILDDDEQVYPLPAPPPTAEQDTIHAFPQGVAAGVCLHAVLENFQFRQPANEQRDYIAQHLNHHGFDADIWCDAVIQMCDFARETPLHPRVNLSRLSPEQTLSEMSFTMHTNHFKLRDIQSWFAQSCLPAELIEASRQLRFHDVHGFMNGAIDLLAISQEHVFIVDYKSNFLGNSAVDYSPNALNHAMAHHHYYLQAWIYAIASARYLQSRHRLPETISVRYLFLRGLDGISSNGVWSWDIATADLEKWL